MSPRGTTPPDTRRLREARRARRQNGLADLFGEQTVTRHHLSELQRLLASLTTFDVDVNLIAYLKQHIQSTMAEEAERLYLLSHPDE